MREFVEVFKDMKNNPKMAAEELIGAACVGVIFYSVILLFTILEG